MVRSSGLLVALVLAVLALVGASPPAEVVVVAHRGASAHAPENTIAALKLAREQRADMVEVDVQETRDHELILMHDTTLGRTTDAEEVYPDRAPWRVGDFTLAEIRKLDAGAWFGAAFRSERVPTLGEALAEAEDLGVVVEIKAPHLYPGIVKRVAGELRRHSGRLVVQSFDWKAMRTFHMELPHVPVGLLGTPRPRELPELARFATQINPPHADLTPKYIDRVHDLGMEVFTWTVDDPEIMRRLISWRVDGIITNRPDTARERLLATSRSRNSD